MKNQFLIYVLSYAHSDAFVRNVKKHKLLMTLER